MNRKLFRDSLRRLLRKTGAAWRAACERRFGRDVPGWTGPRPFNFAATERRLAVGFEAMKLKTNAESERLLKNGCSGKPVANRRSGCVTSALFQFGSEVAMKKNDGRK